VKNILETVSIEQFRSAFEKYGEVTMHDLRRPVDSKINTLYGFIAFKLEKDA
jgi:hypothetical protein